MTCEILSHLRISREKQRFEEGHDPEQYFGLPKRYLIKKQARIQGGMMLGRISSRQGLQVTNALGTKQLKKQKPGAKKSPAKKIPVAPGSNRRGTGKGDGDALWLPNTERPAWLDGSLPGDRGFDPLGLAKPGEFLQIDLDELDQNKAVNKAGKQIGKLAPKQVKLSSNSLQPYDEVFGLQRFRECELIHGRWAMLATLGAIIGEASTGVSWADAGKVELDGTQYLGFSLPFSITQLVWIEALLVGGAEVYRNGELDAEKRIYPGGAFDPLALASDNSERTSKLREAEIKHGRLAMIAFLGFSVQAGAQGTGALGSLAKFSESFAPELAEKLEEIAPIS